MRRHSDEDGLRASTASTAFLTAASHQSPTQVAEEPLSLLFTWGDGHGGALGHGGVRNEVSPRLCTLLLPFKLRTTACGGGYTLVALASGELCSCGLGAGGVLGHGDEKDRAAFEVVQALQGTKVVSLAAGERHCAAISEAGSLFSWGDGSDMQLGLSGDAGVQLTPQPVLQLGSDVHKELASALGGGGGDGDSDDGGEGGGEGGSPRRMTLASKTALMNALRCASVACGGSHTLGSLRSGAVCSWGGGGPQLGRGASANDVPLPLKIGSLSGVRAVATGAAHSMAVTAQGQLWAWGHNGEGQLGTEVTSAKGQGRSHEAPRPLRVASLTAVKVKHVACGACFTLALTAPGDTLSWGDGSNGQLGHGVCTSEAAPRVVKALLGKRARLPACGAAHSAVLCGSGDAYLFGRNGDGALCHPVLQPPVCVGGCIPTHSRVAAALRTTQATAPCLQAATPCTQAATPPMHLPRISHASPGELGLGDASGTNRPLPTLLPACAALGLTVAHVACGSYHTAAIVHLLPTALEATLGRSAAAALRQRLRGGSASALALVAADSTGGPQPSLQYEALAAAPRALTATLVRPPPPSPSLPPPPPPLTEAQARDAEERGRDTARRDAVVQAEHRRAANLTRRTMSDRLGALGGRCCEALKVRK